MDRIRKPIVWTIVLALLITTFYGGGTLASAEQPADGSLAITYKTIEDRQDALGRHPVLMENPTSHNPSYGELTDFLSTDDTVGHQYDKPNFTCADFAEELQNNAARQGIRCGYTSLKFCGKASGHAVNVFETTDEGPVYVDLTSGKTIVTKGLAPGDRYYNLGVIASLTNYW